MFIINIYAQNSIPGLISYWKMDETGGTTLIDCANGHNAVCERELTTDQDGKFGNSQYFDFKDKATVANNEAFNFPAHSSFSIVYWMKFTETQYGLHGGQDHIIISKGDWQTGGPYGAFWASGVNGSGKVNFLLCDDSPHKIDLEGEEHYNDGLWHHVACVRDEALNQSILYADGIVVADSIYDYSGSFTNTYDIAFAHLINESKPEYYYMGSVDEIGIYNKALTSGEINYLMENGNGRNSIKVVVKNEFSLFPIPASDQLNIRFNGLNEEAVVELINSTGNILKSIVIPSNSEMISLPVQDIGPGVYSCILRSNKIEFYCRFIIVR